MKNLLDNLLNSKFKGKVDSLRNLDFLRDALKQTAPLKGDYQFGKKGRGYFKHNLADELVNKITEQVYFNRVSDTNPQFQLGVGFGKKNRWDANLNVGKGNVGFNIGARF